MDKLIVIPLFITLPLIVFWLWMAWDLDGNDKLSSSEKFYWMLAFFFMNTFAAVFYYVTGIEKGINHWFLVLKEEMNLGNI